MNLENYLDLEDKIGNNYKKFLKLKEKFIKEGLPENIAQYKASWVLTPQKLEKIKLNTETNQGIRPSLNFFFNNEEEIKLVTKYFNVSFSQKAVKSADLLIEILKMLEETNGGK